MKCQAARDCRSGVCTSGLCVVPATCTNGRLDPGEAGECGAAMGASLLVDSNAPSAPKLAGVSQIVSHGPEWGTP